MVIVTISEDRRSVTASRFFQRSWVRVVSVVKASCSLEAMERIFAGVSKRKCRSSYRLKQEASALAQCWEHLR